VGVVGRGRITDSEYLKKEAVGVIDPEWEIDRGVSKG